MCLFSVSVSTYPKISSDLHFPEYRMSKTISHAQFWLVQHLHEYLLFVRKCNHRQPKQLIFCQHVVDQKSTFRKFNFPYCRTFGLSTLLVTCLEELGVTVDAACQGLYIGTYSHCLLVRRMFVQQVA